MIESNFTQDISTLKNLPKSWTVCDFADIFADISGGNKKLLKSDFLVEGKIAVVDQGKKLIAGYINEEKATVKGIPPYIVFGDHTRILKFVDFPFAMGADGTKVLKAKDKTLTNDKYLFHFLKSLNIPDTGYNRHFKYLKSAKIPLPPLPQQQKIANILDAADALRQNDKALIAKYDELTQALFLDMFGDPVSNPKGWEKLDLKTLGKVITGSTPPSSKENMFGGDIPFVTPGDLDKNQPYKRFVTEAGALNSRTVNKGSLFVCCIGATIGKTGIARELSSFNQQINAVDWGINIKSQFGYNCFTSLKKELIEKAISTTLPIMKKSEFEKLKMICPPIALQNQFGERVALIEEQKAIAQKSLLKSEELFNSLLQKAFKGELA